MCIRDSPKRIHIVIGEPLEPPELNEKGRLSREAVRSTTEKLREEIQLLFDKAQLKCGTPNVYEPGSDPEASD